MARFSFFPPIFFLREKRKGKGEEEEKIRDYFYGMYLTKFYHARICRDLLEISFTSGIFWYSEAEILYLQVFLDNVVMQSGNYIVSGNYAGKMLTRLPVAADVLVIVFLYSLFCKR